VTHNFAYLFSMEFSSFCVRCTCCSHKLEVITFISKGHFGLSPRTPLVFLSVKLLITHSLVLVFCLSISICVVEFRIYIDFFFFFWQDMESVDTEYYKSLCWIKENDPSELGLTFQGNWSSVNDVTQYWTIFDPRYPLSRLYY
jgi:hypothetical protein